VIHQLRLAVTPAYLLLCLLLGGASAAGIWANLGLQLLGLALIVYALVVTRRTPMSVAGRQIIAISAIALLLLGLQLVPLPPSVWTALPGREPIVRGLEMLGQPLPWLPASLSPLDTRAGLFWTIPALAVLLGIVKLGGYKASTLGWVLVAVTVASVAIGALQVAGADWYFYEISNFGVGTGFFANANHQATLLVSTIPFLSALYLVGRGKRQSAQRSSGMLVILAGVLMVVMVGIALNGSLAGIGLAVPVIGASLLMLGRARAVRHYGPRRWRSSSSPARSTFRSARRSGATTHVRRRRHVAILAPDDHRNDDCRSARFPAVRVGRRHLCRGLPHLRGSGTDRAHLHQPRAQRLCGILSGSGLPCRPDRAALPALVVAAPRLDLAGGEAGSSCPGGEHRLGRDPGAQSGRLSAEDGRDRRAVRGLLRAHGRAAPAGQRSGEPEPANKARHLSAD
jgi:hypothetical protein